mmetsp:Transcript_55373/g.160759  ORF Transcript_55373/g.160759 Transcript_55373/m.160759 type:complete len:297 (+) Transcript_55373:1002-1892(+)
MDRLCGRRRHRRQAERRAVPGLSPRGRCADDHRGLLGARRGGMAGRRRAHRRAGARELGDVERRQPRARAMPEAVPPRRRRRRRRLARQHRGRAAARVGAAGQGGHGPPATRAGEPERALDGGGAGPRRGPRPAPARRRGHPRHLPRGGRPRRAGGAGRAAAPRSGPFAAQVGEPRRLADHLAGAGLRPPRLRRHSGERAARHLCRGDRASGASCRRRRGDSRGCRRPHHDRHPRRPLARRRAGPQREVLLRIADGPNGLRRNLCDARLCRALQSLRGRRLRDGDQGRRRRWRRHR